MKKSALFVSLLVGVSFLFAASPSLAQTSGMTVIPPRLEITTDPGKVVTSDLQIRNETASTQYYSITVDNFIVSDDHGTPVPIPDTISSRWGMKSWIKSPTLIPVDGMTTSTVRISITVPKDALPGGHYALITYQANPDATPQGLSKTGSIIGQRAGTIVYLMVNGPINQNASIKEFKVAKFNELGPVNFSGLIENTSDIHVNAKGSIIISDFLGREITRLPVESGNIFPQTIRSFQSTWPQKWGYGRYTANLQLAYGSAGGVLSATLFFWLFPIRLVIYALMIIISILFIIIILNRKGQKHQVQLEKEVEELKKEIETIEHKQ